MTQAKDFASTPLVDSRAAEIVGTGRHLSPLELRLWTSFLDAGRIIDATLERQLLDEYNMSHREYEVLVRLDGAGGRGRMSELARQIEASGPLITQTIHRLEGRGWVVRRPVVADGRGVEAELSQLGRRALAEAAEPHAQLIRQLLLERVGAERLDVVAGALGEVADHVRAHRKGEDCPDPQCPLN